jgi:hypothetical protein
MFRSLVRNTPPASHEGAASKWVWADDLPAVALEEFVVFVSVGRAALRELLNEAPGGTGV